MDLNFGRQLKWYIIPLLLIGVLIRLVYLYQFSGSPLFSIPLGPDVEEYDLWARQILVGSVLWEKVQIHAPLYPLYLAFLYKICSMDYFLVRFIQLLLGFIVAIPLFFILSKTERDDKKDDSFPLLPYIFFLIWTVYLPLVYYQSELVSESLVLPLICLSIFFVTVAESRIRTDSKKSSFIYFSLAGLCAGLAAITHPLALFFVYGEGWFLFICNYREAVFNITQKKANGSQHESPKVNIWGGSAFVSAIREPKMLVRIMAPCIFFCVFASTMTFPVCLYNSMISGEIVLIQKNSGFNFYLGNNPDATGGCYIRPGPEWDEFHNNAEQEGSSIGISKDRHLINKAFAYIIHHPFSWFYLTLKKMVYTFNFRELTSGADSFKIRYYTPLQRYSRWMFAFVSIFTVYGLFSGLKERRFRIKYRHFIILFTAFLLPLSLLVTSGRYRVPMLPAFFVFSAYGVSVFAKDLVNKRTYLFILVVMSLAAGIVFLPGSLENMDSETAEAETMLGEAYMKSGDFGKAEKSLNIALSKQDNWSRTYNVLGTIKQHQEKYSEAEEMYRQATLVNPESPYGYMNLAVVYSLQKKFDKAEDLLKTALIKSPESVDVLYNYAYFLHRQQEFSGAIEFYTKCLQINPAHRQSLNGLATLLLTERKPEQAIPLYLKALRIAPHNAGIMANLAFAYAVNGEQEKARIYAHRVLEINPKLNTVKKILENNDSK